MTTCSSFNTPICNAIRPRILELLAPPVGGAPVDLDECDDETMPLEYSVWLDGDIIGAAMDPDLAMAEALKTVTAWVS